MCGGSLADTSYYSDAISYIGKHIKNPRFVVFSNDIVWCKNNMDYLDKNTVFVDWNHGADSFRDMQLMSACAHHIIANSSFSWWGAWLGRNKNKIVIAPSTWQQTKTFDYRDLLPASWVKIDNQFD